jgi:hypothetical protein
VPLSVLAAAVTLAAAGCGGEHFSGPAAGSGGSSGSSGSGGAGGGEEPEDVAGDYLVSLTNGANTCPGDGTWVEGNQTTGIPFTIQQDGTRIWAVADGVAAVLFLLITGEVTFEGEIHGDRFSMTDYGSKVTQSGNCTYTVNAVIEGTVTGNTIEGTVTYTPAITDNPDCEALKCQAQQAYSGSRPPPS